MIDRSRRNIAIIATLGLCAFGLNGCVGLAVGGGAAAVNAASQERGLKGAVNDTVIKAKITDLWLRFDKELFASVGLQVVEARALLTGRVDKPQTRLDAVRLAWKVSGVREVINEINITKQGEGSTFVRDTWITTQLKSKILFDRDIESINYSIETVGGVVYLMGIAQNQEELGRVTNHARNQSHVRRVVSHVRLKQDPRRKGT